MREKLLFGCIMPMAASEKRHTRSGDKGPRGKRNPGNHLLPRERAIHGRSNQKRKGDDTSQHYGTTDPPTNSRGQRNEQIDEPERHNRSSQDQKHGQRGQIEGKRKRY